ARHVHLADSLFARTPGERDPERVLLVAIAVLLAESLRAAVLLARVAVDAVVDLAAHFAGAGAGIGQREPVAAPSMLGHPFHFVRLRSPERHERLEIERVREAQERPPVRLVSPLRVQRRREAPAVEQIEQGLAQTRTGRA